MDLADAVAKRPALAKTAYKARVSKAMRSAKSQAAASNIAKGLRAACKRVAAAKGAESLHGCPRPNFFGPFFTTVGTLGETVVFHLVAGVDGLVHGRSPSSASLGSGRDRLSYCDQV